MTCPSCGAPLPEGAMFCGECGRAVRFAPPEPVRDARAAAAADTAVIERLDPGGRRPEPLVEPVLSVAPEPLVEPELSTGRESESAPPRAAPDYEAVAFAPAEPAPADAPEAPKHAAPETPSASRPLITAVPRTAPGASAPEPSEALPRARPPAPPAEPSELERFVLQFSTGESVTVTGGGLVGRNPVTEPNEYVDHLVTIADPLRSVSKTHLEFGQQGGSFWVLDRFSGNGTIVRPPDGEARRCEPGRRYPVSRGTRIDIGDQFFVVS